MNHNKFENWLPLESNSTVINKYIGNLGVTDMLKYFDVVSFDLQELQYIPQPVLAALFTFPDLKQIRDHYNELVEQQQERKQKLSEDIYFMEQTATNACGTVGLLHALINLSIENGFLFKEDNFIQQFYQDTLQMTPEERAEYLETCKALNIMHTEAVHEGSGVVNVETKVNHHFITFIWKNGHVVELDGRKPFPLIYQECTQEEFLPTLFQILQEHYMGQAPQEIGYNLMVLSTDFTDFD